jgi:hypothetical protein
MMDGTIIQVGSFVSTGADVFIPLESGVDWMTVYNYSVYNAQTINSGLNFYWQLGMAQNDGLVEYFNGASTAILGAAAATFPGGAVPGFILQNTSVPIIGAQIPITAISNATPPVVSTGNTAGLVANQTVVRLYNLAGVPGADQFGGIDFTVGTIINNVSFTLQNEIAIVASGALAAASYSIVQFPNFWYPNYRVISNITQAVQAVVSTTVNSGFLVGQQIRFSNMNQVIPGAAAYGMTQINGLVGNIVAVAANGSSFTVDINTTGFSPFAFPTSGNTPVTFALAVPVGENTATALAQNPQLSTLNDATINIAQTGMLLKAGITSPAGLAPNVIFWKAGKSFNT